MKRHNRSNNRPTENHSRVLELPKVVSNGTKHMDSFFILHFHGQHSLNSTKLAFLPSILLTILCSINTILTAILHSLLIFIHCIHIVFPLKAFFMKPAKTLATVNQFIRAFKVIAKTPNTSRR